MAFQALIEEIGIRDPLEALAALPAQPGLVFLDSAMAHPELGRWSWLAADPFGRFTSVGGEAAWNGARLPGHPIEALRTILRRFPMNPGAADLPFLGGASGFFSYEAGRLFERLPQPKASRASCPEIDLAFHDCGVVFDTLEDRAFIVSTGWPEADTVSREKRARERADWLRERLLAGPMRRGSPIRIPRGAWRPNTSPDRFKAHVERTRRYIADGDIFQANLTQAWRAELPAGFDPLSLYGQLREANPAPFGALLLTPDRVVASTSPEGFLKLERRSVETRPIKGTSRRSSDPQRIAASRGRCWLRKRTGPKTS
jgi:para-aminobenzoate synthetase component 1